MKIKKPPVPVLKIAVVVSIVVSTLCLVSRARATWTYPNDGGSLAIDGAFYCVAVQLNNLECVPFGGGSPRPPSGGTASDAGQPIPTDGGTAIVISPTGTIIFSGQMDGGAFYCVIGQLNQLQCVPASGTND
jgi:hypothetical protein